MKKILLIFPLIFVIYHSIDIHWLFTSPYFGLVFDYNGKNNIIVSQILPFEGNRESGIRQDDVLVSVNGKRFQDLKEVKLFLNDIKAEKPVKFVFDRNSHSFHAEITPSTRFAAFPNNVIVMVLLKFILLTFLITGVLVYIMKKNDKTAFLFFMFFLTIAFTVNSPTLFYLSPWLQIPGILVSRHTSNVGYNRCNLILASFVENCHFITAF